MTKLKTAVAGLQLSAAVKTGKLHLHKAKQERKCRSFKSHAFKLYFLFTYLVLAGCLTMFSVSDFITKTFSTTADNDYLSAFRNAVCSIN